MMKTFSIVWRVLINLATFAVFLSMFHIAKSPFEMIVMSALVLIYVSMISSFSILGHALSQKGHTDLARFIEIARSLRLNTELYEEAQREDLEEFKKIQVGFLINAGFNWIFGLSAIVNLFYAFA